MPTRAQTHVDRILTNISVAYMQDPSVYIADKVFPLIPVPQQSARYFQYKKEDWFRDDAQERALGTESAGGDYDIDNTPTYFAKKYAYHKDVFEEDRVNSDVPLTPDQDATEFVSDKLLLRREVIWAARFFVTGVWGTEYTGNSTASAYASKTVMFWDNPASTPIEDVTRMLSDMGEATGKRPNTIVLGQRVYDALKNHPDFLDRIKYTQKGVVTTDLIATLFECPSVYIASAVKNTANPKDTATMGYIFGKNVLLCYSEPNPGLKKASAGYIFNWTGLLGSGAYGGRILRIPVPLLGEGTERIEGEMAFDMKVVAKDLGCFINGAVSV
jgi:hypothetical protein